MTKINIGLDNNQRNAVADGLITLLADSYALYEKTHGYHWNVTGPQFHSLHTMFEGQYQEIWTALDEIAERIRSLGIIAPAPGASLAVRTSIEPALQSPPPAEKMVDDLLNDHELLIRRARENLSLAEDASDAVSADLITIRLQAHEKTAWMLRSTKAA